MDLAKGPVEKLASGVDPLDAKRMSLVEGRDQIGLAVSRVGGGAQRSDLFPDGEGTDQFGSEANLRALRNWTPSPSSYGLDSPHPA